jgi:hypothetical protein
LRRSGPNAILFVFQHIADGLPFGAGVASTAKLSPAQSIALVSTLRAMVCVDSAFLRAGAGLRRAGRPDVRTTEGTLFTRHRRRSTMIAAT